jgi:hypothetical protein
MTIITDEVLKNLADDASDFAEGDVEYNVAIKLLALRELLRRTEDRLHDMQNTFLSEVNTCKYWYEKAKDLGYKP